MYIWWIPHSIIMKKNAFTAIVILLITVAFLFVVNDLSHTKEQPSQANTHKTQQHLDFAGFDEE